MSAEAGWYDDGSGRQRWWDGASWTDRFEDEKKPSRGAEAVRGFAARMTSQHDASQDGDALWSAVGKPLTGIGVGRYKLTAEYLLFEKGTLSTKAQQIRTSDIYDVDASQSLAQKARGVGTITLFAERGNDQHREKVQLEDIPNFREGVSAINSASFEAREARRIRENTQHVSYAGAHPIAPVMPAAPAQSDAPALDLNAELLKLAELKAAGILDDEEFTAAKRQLLGLT